LAAYLTWGLFPLYWPLLKPANAVEILAQRMVWTLVFVLVLVWRLHAWTAVRAVLADRRKRTLLVLAAIAVSINWGVYIWGVNAGHVIETSLGYFINPLLTIVLGVFVLRERLRWLQWTAVAIASAAIIVLTIDYGRLPWIALTLACSFGLYGFLKNRAAVGAVESLTIETGVLALPALITLTVLAADGNLAFGHHGVANTALLAGSGIVTAIPLLFFASAARQLPLSTIGLMQYLTPVLQFIVGVTVDHEKMPASRWAGFVLVWVALVVLTVDGVRNQRAQRTQPVRANTI
jgi:chloramphenicol-sensitive protein RarD